LWVVSVLSVFSLSAFNSLPMSKERVRERSLLGDGLEDRFQDAIHIREYFVVPESQNLVTAILNQLRTAIISRDCLMFGMLSAVKFDY
jgi:hypothetical protein